MDLIYTSHITEFNYRGDAWQNKVKCSPTRVLSVAGQLFEKALNIMSTSS